MNSEIAMVIREVTKLRYVSRAWIEWKLEPDGQRIKALVIEVTFDTDPHSPKFRPSAMNEIEASIKDTLANKTTMIIHDARVVPSGLY